MVIFAVGTIVFATAQHMDVLVAGRLIQGLGGGGLDVLQEIILADITTLKERPKYLAVIAVAIAVGSVSGPVVGAVFSQYINWRWIGWINLPIVGLAFVLALCFLHLRPMEEALSKRLRRIDWTGMLLYAIGSTAFALPLSWADALYSWSSWRTLVPLIIGLLLLVAFGFYEKKPPEAILPYRIFANNRTAISSFASGLIHGLILYPSMQYVPLLLQAVRLEAPLQAGISTLPFACSVVAFSIIAPVTVEITRRYRSLVWLGWICSTVSMGTWCLVGQNTPWASIYVIQVFLGAGLGILYTVTQFSVQASVKDVNDTGLAVGILVVLRIFGALIGLSICSTLFSSVFQQKISGIGVLPQPAMVLMDSSQAISFIPTLRTLDLPAQTMYSIIKVYQDAFVAVWILLTCFSAVGLLTSLVMRELTLENEEVGRQGFQQSSES